MSLDAARAYLREYGMENRVRELEVSIATVELAAEALGVAPARIAKTLSFKNGGDCILVVAAGDARIDNRGFKERFGVKAKMLTAEEVPALIGHEVGGVCPFGVKAGVPVYVDESIRRFETVFPSAGSTESALEMTPEELFSVSDALGWVAVCKVPETEA